MVGVETAIGQVGGNGREVRLEQMGKGRAMTLAVRIGHRRHWPQWLQQVADGNGARKDEQGKRRGLMSPASLKFRSDYFATPRRAANAGRCTKCVS